MLQYYLLLNLRGTFNNSSSWVLCHPFFCKISDSETQTMQNLGTIIVETSQKISPTEDRRDQKERDQTEDSQMQGKQIEQICPIGDGKTPKVYKILLVLSFGFNFISCFIT